ncbi:hypothetical protein AVL59_32280 [Streptomyces griseochromogenes]|uniref:Uncharacterized protein n=1 Tax=Streptomyces griseochromogenes TaxID=68214 RepID=A0A1B1B4A9_9ACTN|nr:hypothetical protein AVL59_32280 [Streptomyces griseochromogenes]
MPTGDCFCGCGEEAEIGRWFVLGHDITAAAALRALQGMKLPQRLVTAGFGPGRSVVQAAVEEAGWVRCAGCSYAGTPANLAAHTRAGSCTADAPADEQQPPARPDSQSAVPEPAGPAGRTRSGRAAASSAAPVPAESGAARGRLLPGADAPSWEKVPLHLRQQLRGAAYQLVTPVQGPLKKPENRRLLSAVRAAGRMRMTGAQWLLLLTAPREAFGSPRSQRARALYEALEHVAAEHTEHTESDAGREAADHQGEAAAG